MSQRVQTPALYLSIFAALIVLTCLTVAVSFVHLGAWHTATGLTIAVCKALLVALFFMHLLHSGRLTWLVVLGSVFWLALLICLTLTDYLTRHWLTY